jgi:hypothetical protein
MVLSFLQRLSPLRRHNGNGIATTPNITPMPVVGDAPVGRDVELREADALLERVAAGRGCVAVVLGEAGVGKTSLLEAMARRAASRGFAVAIGRCAASESPPFWPWPRVLRRLGIPDDAVTRSAGRAALFADAADHLERASAVEPVFVAIDDLHWADESSLALGSFLAAATAGMRIALVFAARDDPAEATPALTDALAALPADVLRLTLGGLDVVAAGEVVADVFGYAPPPALVEELHARTGGNPLFLQECARLLVGRAGSVPASVPDRVRQVITRRLARLSEPSYTVSTAAAVADDFDLDLLAALTATTAADVAGALGEAIEARLVVDDDDGPRFVHALIRETLLDTQPVSRRGDLHERAARVLEARLEHAPNDGRAALAGRAAAHWAHVPGGRPRAAQLAVEAARSAARQVAYDHATRLYEWSRQLGDDNLDTITELGEAQVLAGRLADGRQTLAAAAERAADERRGDALARAVLAAGSGVGGYEVDVRDDRQVVLLRDALSLLGHEDSTLRAACLARVGLVDASLPVEQRAALADDAAGMAVRLGDLVGEVAALAARCDILSGPDHVDDRLATTARMVELARSHGDPTIALLARRHRILALLERGHIGSVDHELAAYARTSDRLRLPLYSWMVPLWRGMRALMDGDQQRAAELCDEADALGRAAGSANADALVFTLRFAIARARGTVADMESEMARIAPGYEGYPAAEAMHAVVLVSVGRADQARGLLLRRMAEGIETIPRDSEWIETLWTLGDVAVDLGELDAVEAIHDALTPYAELWAVDGVGAACFGAVSHQLGRLSLTLDRDQAARHWLDAAEHAHRAAGAEALALASAALRASLSSQPPRSRTGPSTARGALNRDGPIWHVEWQGRAATVRHSKGILDIARLLDRPGREIHVLDLVAPTGAAPDRGGTGPMLDDTAKRAYQQRLQDLEEDIEEATSRSDEARVARLENERELLVREISRAYGLGERPRSAGDPVERARKAVGMRIATAIRAIAASDPDLARHLDRSILTGRYCSYQPETDATWDVSAQAATSARRSPRPTERRRGG